MAARIYTRSGDDGATGLIGGRRVPKDDLVIEACGAVDELNASLGVARSMNDDAELDSILAAAQDTLFTLGADLASPPQDLEGSRISIERLTAERSEGLEHVIDRLEADLPPLTRFILPGGGAFAAHLHLARTVCRRAERRCVALAREQQDLNREIVRCLNRLSDLLFVMARTANCRLGVEDVVWNP